MSTTTFTAQTAAPVIWAPATTIEDYAWGVNSLASGSMRVGEVGDLAASRGMWYNWSLITQWGTAPTDGTLLKLWFVPQFVSGQYVGGESGGIDGTDKTISTAAILTRLERDMQPWYIGEIVADNSTTTRKTSGGPFQFPYQYGLPVLLNDATGTSLDSTAGNHAFYLTPVQGLGTVA